jgi:hypothetical protein
MKKNIMASLLILVLWGVLSCQTKALIEEPEPKATIFSLMPSETIAAVKFSSYEKILYIINSYIARLDTGEKADIEEMKTELGFNPFDLQEMKKRGVDTAREFGIGFSHFSWNQRKNQPRFNMNMYVPVSDSALYIGVMKQVLQKNYPQLEWKTEKNISYVLNHELSFAITDQKDYVIMTTSIEQPPSSFLPSLQPNLSLADTVPFKAIQAKVDISEDVCGYIDYSRFFTEKNVVKMFPGTLAASMKALSGYQDMLATIDLDSRDFLVEMAISMKPGADVLKMTRFTFDKTPLLKIKNNPILFLATGANPVYYVQNLKNSMGAGFLPRYDKIVQQVKKEFGIDFEKDIVQNMEGSLNYGMFDGGSLGPGKYNSVLSFNVKDPRRMKEVLDTLLPKLALKLQHSMVRMRNATIEGVATTVFQTPLAQMYIGIKDKNVIIALDREMYVAAITGTVESGFSSKMGTAMAVKIKGDFYNLFVDFNEVQKAINNIFPGTQKRRNRVVSRISNMITPMKYLFIDSHVEGNTFYGSIVLKTKFTQPFFIGLQEIIFLQE